MFVSVTIEEGGRCLTFRRSAFHAGGQAIWIARILAQLGVRPRFVHLLVESGCALRGLALQWNIELGRS